MSSWSNEFETRVYEELFDSPFEGYTPKKERITNVILDFCAALAHNPVLYPKGVPQRERENAFYTMYAFGVQLVVLIFKDDEAAMKTYVKDAIEGLLYALKNIGITEELAYKRIKTVNQNMRSAGDDFQRRQAQGVANALSSAYLSLLHIDSNSEKLNALSKEIGSFSDQVKSYATADNRDIKPAKVNRYVCKACGSNSTGWYQVCPACGASGQFEKNISIRTYNDITDVDLEGGCKATKGAASPAEVQTKPGSGGKKEEKPEHQTTSASSEGKRKYDIGRIIKIVLYSAFWIAFYFWAFKGCVALHGGSKEPDPTPEPTVTYKEPVKEMTDEERHIEEVIHTPVYLVEEKDYELWREYNPFDIWMIFETWENVDSSSIESVSYCRPYDALGIMFTTDEYTCYVYWDVSPSVAFDLKYADSPGKYYNENIKGEYAVTKYKFDKESRQWYEAD